MNPTNITPLLLGLDEPTIVQKIQSILNVAADGDWGPKTQSAFDGRSIAQTEVIQAYLGVEADGLWGPKSQAALDSAIRPSRPNIAPVQFDEPNLETFGTMQITRDGIDMIVNFETGGRAYYDKFLAFPSWPVPRALWDIDNKNNSGVTIGIGYDLGHEDSFEEDWKGKLAPDVMVALKTAIGKTKRTAQALASRLKTQGIVIPWDTAIEVFLSKTLPLNARLTSKAYKGADLLHPKAQAALISMVYQWGPSIRTTGQRWMVPAVAKQDYAGIAAGFRRMKGLAANDTSRRETEARMVEAGGKLMALRGTLA